MNLKLFLTIFILLLVVLGVYWLVPWRSAPSPSVEANNTCGDLPPTLYSMRFTQPEQIAQPTILQTQAIGIATKEAFISDQLPAPMVKAQFVLYSNDVVGRSKTQNDDEADKNLLYQDRPAWIISYCGLKIQSFASKDTGQKSSTRPFIRQEWNVVVDAQTGEVIHEFSFR